jgi:hypothetical protein
MGLHRVVGYSFQFLNDWRVFFASAGLPSGSMAVQPEKYRFIVAPDYLVNDLAAVAQVQRDVRLPTKPFDRESMQFRVDFHTVQLLEEVRYGNQRVSAIGSRFHENSAPRTLRVVADDCSLPLIAGRSRPAVSQAFPDPVEFLGRASPEEAIQISRVQKLRQVEHLLLEPQARIVNHKVCLGLTWTAEVFKREDIRHCG